MATEITIVRHGETIWNVAKRIQGQSNSKLTSNGELQAELVGKALKKRTFDILISSDLERAAQTARIMNKHLNLPHLFSSKLRERSFGIMEGKTFDEIEKDLLEEYENIQKRNPKYIIPGGESLEQLYHRVCSEIAHIAKEFDGKKVLLVSHGLVLEMMMYKTFSIGLEKTRMFSINNSSVSSFNIDQNQWFLKEWGVIEHLVSLNVLNEL